MSKSKNTKIESLKELQLLMPRIVNQVNGNPQLALAATANPILALEYLGYSFTPKARKEIESYGRFGPDGLQQLAEVEKHWKQLFGSEPIPASKEMAKKMFAQLAKGTDPRKTKSRKMSSKSKSTRSITLETALDLIYSKIKDIETEEKNKIESLEQIHEALPLLYQYQKILSQRTAFARKEKFEQLLKSEQKTPLSAVKFRLKSSEERRRARS
ncbi:hypothetical protein [Flavilitoribacter nigricans]|uniref:Uncharacterized protein n=1 Tax=Flavilitoribacter nigricans (strain ATCC 23147 / DSM 23189 / NBRC 102662 / NCIMB 1420 / SS-2) TaxID=1122177 RepID=A0A2D0MZQ7_FLAN2|nr:hypothetical protein [Flavilitoribacter nigricans]PHN00933.1 hypothetical protein CRP01_39755 [Flavilitoribacter nigricans DSM 23189 = NBRC 102662]